MTTNPFLAETDGDTHTLDDGHGGPVVIEVDPQLHAVAAEPERDSLPHRGKSRRELEPVTAFDHAGESVNDPGPDSTSRGDVHPVRRVAVIVGQVEIERAVEVVDGLLLVADSGGDDRLHTGRQR